MRHIGRKAYAGVAASWASSALLALLSSTGSSVGVVRPALHLSRASEQLLGPSSGRNCLGGGYDRPTRRPWSIGPSCSPPTLPTAASLATTSVVVMIGNVCAVSGSQNRASREVSLCKMRDLRVQIASSRSRYPAHPDSYPSAHLLPTPT